MKFIIDNGALVCYKEGEIIRIEPWGKDSLRVRATKQGKFTDKEWALTEKVEKTEAKITIEKEDHWVGDGTIDKKEIATIINGHIKAVVNFVGIITFYKAEKKILREYYRFYDGTISEESRCLKVINREWKGIIGGSEYSLNVKFETNKDEKIFGMRQYQQEDMELKGCRISTKKFTNISTICSI